MATLGELASPDKGVRTSEAHFFWIMAVIMSAIIVAGFSVNLVLGRSTFAVPLAYHVHAAVFFGWVALYLAQNGLVATNNRSEEHTSELQSLMRISYAVFL